MAKKKKEDLGYGRYRYENFKDTEGGYSKTRYTFESFQKKLKQDEENERKRRIREQQEEEARRKAEREASFERTKEWQQEYNNAQYGPDGDQRWQVYAAKMISDTPGAFEREQKRQQEAQEKRQQEANKYWRDLSREATNAGTPEIAYAAKQIHDSPVSRTDITKYGSESAARQAKLNEFLEGLNKQKRTEQYGKRAEDAYQIGTGTMDVSKVWGQTPKALSDAMQVQNAKESAAAIRKMRSAGDFDDQGDISLWSPNKRQSAKAAMKAQATVYQKQIDELNRQIGEQENTGNRWDPLLDLYTSEEVEKLRDILYDRDFSEEERNRGEGHTKAEKQKAQEQLDWILNRTKGIGSQSVSDSAKNFYKYNQKNLNEYRDHMNMDSMRRMAYDAVNGNGAYDQIMSGLKGYEQKELNDRIDTALDYVTDENGRLGVQLRTAQSQLDYINGQIKDINYYDKQDRKVDELLEGYRTGDTQFHEEYVTDAAKQAALPSYSRTRPHGETGGIVNPVDAVYATLGGYGYSDEQNITGVEYHNALLMEGIYASGSTRSAKDIFISLYNEGKKDQAWAFYQGLQPTLNQMYHYYDQLSMEDTTMKLPIITSTVSVALSPVQSLEYLYNLPGRVESYITGKQTSAADPYSGNYAATRAKNTIRNKITQELGDWGWTYQGAMSGADSAFNAALGKGIINTLGSTVNLSKEAAEGIMKYGTLGLFATQAFETSLQNNMETGSDNFAYDVIEAYIDSAIETATEIWSVENWLANPKNILTFVGKIAISEPSEEIVGAIVEPYIKEMLGHKNQYTERANEILANGGYQDGDQWVKVTDIDTATRQAMREWNHDIRMAAQEALLSVGPSMVFGSAQNAMQTRGIGSVLNMYEDSDAVKQMAEKAVAMGEGTDSYKSGQGILDRLVKGKKAGNYQVGQLAQNVLREGGETISETTAQTRKEQIAGFLQENGVSEEDSAGLAETVEKAIEKGGIEKLSKKERQAIHANQAATNALYRFGMTEGKHTDVKTQEALTEEVKNRTQKETEAVKSISDLFNKNTERKLMLREATPDEISEVKGERINNNREVIVYDRKTGEGRFAQIEGIEVKKRNGNWNLRLRVAGQDRTLSASDVKLTNYQTAQVINQATNIPELYSEGYTNLLLDAANEGQFTNENIVDMMRDAKKLRLYAYAGFLSDQVPQTNLPQQLAERIWQQGTEEKYSNRKSQVAGYNRQKVGKAVYGDAVFGTEAWNDATKDLDADTVDWMETIAGVAQRAGIDVSFKNMTENDKTWGWENKEGIGLNIAGMNYVRDAETGKVVQTGQKHHMLVTFGHEMTHWLMRNSMQGYNKLEKFVLQNYINDNGYDQFEEKINYRMYQMGESLDEAIAEIVADSCDQILLDKKVQDKIAKTDSKLFSEIKGFVKNLVERFKKAIKGMPQDSASEYSKAMARHVSEINKLWLGAYDEALSGYITEDNGTRLTAEEYRQMVAEETENEEQIIKEISENARMSIAELPNGRKYVEVDVDQKQFSKLNAAQILKAAKSIIINKFAQAEDNSYKLPDGTGYVTVTGETANEYVFGAKREMSTSVKKAKGKVSTEIDNLIKTSWRVQPGDPLYPNPSVGHNPKNMKYYAVLFRINGKAFYTGILNVEVRKNSQHLKDLTQIKIDTSLSGLANATPPANTAGTPASANKTLTQNNQNGNILHSRAQTTADALQKDLQESNGKETHYGDYKRFSRAVTDQRELNFLNNQETIKTYKTMQLIDGKLYPPMAAVVAGSMEDASVLGKWEKATEHPELIKEGNQFTLNKGKGKGSLKAAYNPYMHSSNLMINDQFKGAYNRPNLVTVECEVPVSELSSGYHAEFAKDNVGWHSWHTGEVASKIRAEKGIERQVMLSRWIKPVRIVDNAEVAAHYAELLNGTDIAVPDNVVPPQLLTELKKAGVKILESGKVDTRRFSRAQLDNAYMAAVRSGDTAQQQELVYEAGRKAGWAIKAYHGTQRGDRVGNEFRPDRATSGPMAFFTDNRGIAENYARDKRDTSIDYDPDYHEEGWEDYDWQFKVKDKNGKYVPVHTLWDNMNYSQKQKFIENAKHITTDDEGEIVYDEDTNDGLGNYDEYTLRDYKGNGIDALVYSWVKAGELLGDEETFIKVLEMAGIKDAKWFNPNESHEKVYDVLLNIQNPFDTSTMYTMDFLEELSDWYYGKQGHSVYEKPEGVTNMWDKKGTTVWNWIQYGWDDMRTGSTGNWTRIPDGVTDFLKYKGYDGIKDTGGKGGGETHTVWIPFSSEQVKSADPVTYDNDGNVIPLSERFDASKMDIRWSRAQADVDPRQQELSEAWQKARDEANALREQVRAMKPEMDAWANKLTEAMENGTFNELMPEYKEWEKGYSKLNNDLYEAEQRYKDANRAYDNYIEERDVAEEQAKIKASGLSEADYRRKQAVNEFGYTTDFREAGYLLPNGKMLNFTGEKGKHYGTRGEDHRGIGRIYASRENQGGAAMLAFMRDGNIRVMAETPGIDLITTIEPTREQYEQIRNMARRFAGEHYFNVDLTDEHGYTDDSIEYDGRVDPNKVVNDIKSYYKTGVVPTQSTVSQFHYSRWTESGMDVNYWMEHATPSMVQTEDERELISMYRGKRTSISLSLKKQGEYRARIRQLEAVDNPSTDVKSELTALRNKLEIEKKKVYRLEEEILQITRNDGWAGMMYQHNMVFRDYVEGRTQEQVRQTIDDMLKLVEQTQEQVTKDTENLKKLATHQAVQTMKSFMGKTSMGKMASILRKTYNSTMNKAEIEDRLAEMALKQASGKDITGDTEALAQDLLDRMRGIRTDTLESLRGQTLVIGQSLAEELRKENSSIKELQSRIKGSGVKLTTGVKSSTGEIDKHSRISEQWKELRESNAALPDVENMAEIDKLHTIVDFIESELRASTGAEQFNADFDEVAAMVRASVGNITTYLTDDPNARAQINNLMKQIADLSKATEKTAADMQGLYGRLDEVMQAGARAKGIATAMERDVNEAIKYYNTTARVAAEKERTKVRKALIAQLRDETTQKLLKQQEKYRSMIENNQKARELHQDNEALRRKISTVASRMANRLFAETDQKNVPEETKGLVREVLRMLSENDSIYRKVTNWDKDRIEDAMKRLTRLSNQHGEFVPAKDLDFLVIKAPNEADNDYTLRDKVWQDIMDIESGLEAYRKAETATLVNQQAKNDALTKIQEALSEIYSVVRARSEAFIQGKRYEVATLAEQMENEMAGSKYKGERTGKIGRTINTIEKMVGYGNLTPEYFFKNLKNGVMKILHGGFHDAEQRAGLEALRAKAVVEKIAKDTKYNTWDPQEKHQVKLQGGREITMTTEQIMALYATWKRESSQLRPEETAHLLKGGFVLAQGDLSEGIYGRQRNDQRPIRMNEETLEGLRNYLTEDQIRYVVELVNYMSGELAEIGNETSMQQYGIKKFTERYYYPIKAWGGVLNKSSASGIVNKSDARAMRQSFTKNLTANAQNAIEIGDFTPTVMNHIVGMITFNTVGPAVENMNKVLNQQLTYGEAVYDENGEIAEDNRYKRNVRAIFQDAYGVNALKYLERFMDDVNGGMTRQQDKSLQEKLLSVFRKGAVAGSLSVAAQQPLSYIRAAMKINPVYLARALAPTHWGKIHDEMLKYSGVAVIKDMGRFDMNQGQSMIDFITPEEKTSKARKAGRTAVEATTILPQKMDALTWGRMWIACKLETAAKNKGMDQKSDEFLQKVAQRFNEVMRQTQVYDSMMVKSQNMRSTNYAIKAMTSFMAEPSLSLNVLADAVRNFNEKGGKLNMGKAAATFIMSAALQALVKAIMSSGRSPDKKKKFEEQFLTKWHSMFMSEVDPLTLIPGYSDIIELFKNGELADDAWGALGKFKTIAQTGIKWATGKSNDHYRNFEDTVGQLAQLMTNVPLKNLMRDARAIYNFFNPETYAKREYSSAMTKYGIKDSFYTADNMIGLVNSYLQMAGAGYGTTANDYYERIYGAEKAGNKQDAENMREYVLLKSTAEDPQKSMDAGLRKLAKNDDSLTAAEKYEKQKEYGLVNGGSYIKDEYEAGNLTRQEAEKLYRQENPNASDKDVMAAFDKIDYEKKAGKELDSYSNYTPLYDAISNNKSDEIKAVVKHMTDNGYKAEDIKKQLTTKYKQAYLDAKGSEKTKLMDALTKAYKAIGLSAEDALKIINGWKPKKDSSKQTETKKEENKDTTGRWGRGNIDLNNRQVVKNADGSISTEASFSVNIDGKEVLLPTIIDGKRVSEEEAIRYYERTGKYLGKFNTVKEADEYAEKLHERQDWYYNRN